MTMLSGRVFLRASHPLALLVLEVLRRWNPRPGQDTARVENVALRCGGDVAHQGKQDASDRWTKGSWADRAGGLSSRVVGLCGWLGWQGGAERKRRSHQVLQGVRCRNKLVASRVRCQDLRRIEERALRQGSKVKARSPGSSAMRSTASQRRHAG